MIEVPSARAPRVSFALACIVAVGLAIRLYEAATIPFWFDEAFSFRVSQESWSELVRRCADDNHSPLYFGLLKLWTSVAGTSVLALRAPSIAFGTATIAVMYVVVRDAIDGPRGKRAALLAALFVAVLLPAASWSAIARMYALAMLLAAASTLALLRASRGTSKRSWAVYGALAALAVYAHYYLCFFVFAHGVYVAAVALARRRFPLQALVAVALFVALWLPWIGVFLDQRTHTGASWWMPPLGAKMVIYEWYLVVGQRFHDGFPDLWIVAVIDVASLAALAYLAWRGSAAERLVVLLATLPYLAGVVVSVRGANILVPWYHLSSQLFLAAAAASLVTRIPQPRWCAVVASATAGVLVAGLVADQRVEKLDLPYDRVVTRLADVRPGDRVIVDSFDYFPLTYLAPDLDLEVYAETGRLEFYDGGTMLGSGDRVVGKADVENLAGRVWIIENDAKGSVAKPAALRVVGRQTFGLVTVTQYVSQR
jgi:hypothetical protein